MGTETSNIYHADGPPHLIYQRKTFLCKMHGGADDILMPDFLGMKEALINR